MKKIILLTLASFLVIFSQAQITKGSILLGGSFNFNKSKSDGLSPYINGNYWGIDPSFGIALKENLIYGIDLGYNHNENAYNSYGGGIFLRKYFPLGKGFYFFGEPALNYGHMESPQYPASPGYSVNKNWNLNLSLSPGLSYALSRKFQLETILASLVNIYYVESRTDFYDTSTPAPPSKGSQFGLNSSLSNSIQLNVGFRFLIAK